MVMKCCVKDCNSRLSSNIGNQEKQISFHRFPSKNTVLLQKWLNAISRENGSSWLFKQPSDRVCSLHFRSSDFLIGLTKRTLKRDACPNLGSDNSSCVEAEPVTSRVQQTFTKYDIISDGQVKEEVVTLLQPKTFLSVTEYDSDSSGMYPTPKRGKLKHDHPYSLNNSFSFNADEPYKMLLRENELLKEQLKEMKKSEHAMKQRLKRAYLRKSTLEELLDQLKKNQLRFSEQDTDFIKSKFSKTIQCLLRNIMNNKNLQARNRQYSEEVQRFAVTLYRHSRKAYCFLQDELVLPSPLALKELSY